MYLVDNIIFSLYKVQSMLNICAPFVERVVLPNILGHPVPVVKHQEEVVDVGVGVADLCCLVVLLLVQ